MAVTRTFPSRDALRRFRFRPLDAVVGAGVFLLLYAIARVGASAHVPFHPSQVTTIDTSPSRLPYNLDVHGWERWRRMILPAVFPAYVTGAITAAGGAWNASIVAEIVIYNRHTLVASGLGSYITQATARNDFHEIIAGILVMAVYVTGLNALLWRRLYSIAESKYALA